MSQVAVSNIYPIGEFVAPTRYDAEAKNHNIDRIAALPDLMKKCISSMPDHLWKKSYRENGWNALQLIHHLADSNINGYLRFRLSLTEDNPVIKPYNQDLFAQFYDSTEFDPLISVQLHEPLILKFTDMLRRMSDEDFQRTYYNPEYNKTYILYVALALYAWHGEHHMAQFEVIKKIHGA